MPRLKTRHPPSAQLDPNSDAAKLRDAIETKLTYVLGKTAENASDNDWYQATVLAVRDRIVDIWMDVRKQTKRQKKKRVYYLSIEFLIGRLLLDTLSNLRLVEPARHALARHGRRSRPAADGRAGRSARQWRARAAGRLLHGQPVGARHPGLWLRHPLRERVVRAAHQGRLAEGISRGLAGTWQSVGIRALGLGIFGGLRRHGGISRRRRGHRARRLVSGADRAGDALRHADHRLARPPRQCAAAVVGARALADPALGARPRRRGRRNRRARALGSHIARALSQRCHARGPGTAPAAGIFLHLGVAAGHHAPPLRRIRHARNA